MQSPRKKFREYFLKLGGLLALGLFAFAFVPSTPKDAGDQLVEATAESFEVTVSMVGILDAANSQVLASSLKGDKGKIIYFVEDGTPVKAGDVVVKLNPAPFEEEMRRVGSEVKSRESAAKAMEQVLAWEKNEVEKQIESAVYNRKIAAFELEKTINGDGPVQVSKLKNELDKASQEYDRYSSYLKDLRVLEGQGHDLRNEVEQTKAKTENLRQEMEIAKEKYSNFKNYELPLNIETAKTKSQKADMELEKSKTEGVYKIAKATADMEKARNELGSSRAALAQAEAELQQTVIRAPIPGIAVLYETFRDNQKRKAKVGDTVWQNQPLLYIPDVSRMIIKTRIREVDLYKISLGQKAVIRVDAWPDAFFNGEVGAIGAIASEESEISRGGEKYFSVTIVVKGEDKRLKPGMSARIIVHGDNAKDILTVPLQAIFHEDHKKYCYVYAGGKYVRREVNTGRQNEDLVEVRSGLGKGERVSIVKPPADAVSGS